MTNPFSRNKQPIMSGSDRSVGVPGFVPNDAVSPEMSALLLNRREDEQVIGEKEIQEAASILKKYKDGKAALESRIIEDELWWELRHWEAIRGEHGGISGSMRVYLERMKEREKSQSSPEPSSAWLFNAILNKHADAMDNYPESIVLPREPSDEQSAKVLSSVLPVINEQNGFEQVYSDNWWEKLKHGTAAYGVFWNNAKENGLGDIDIKSIDMLKIFWEPGIKDIQVSKNLFIVELVDSESLEAEYPQCKGKTKGDTIEVPQYIYDETIDTTDKCVVVDWYYKVKAPSGKTLLHYVKFVGNTLLYASENDPQYRETGYYEHGLYPVVLDVMFPEKGTPAGFGYVAICKDPQLYIDKLSANILESSLVATKKRFFVSSSTNINKNDFLDINNPLVEVEGEIDDRRVKEIVTQPISGIYANIVEMKINEMKETAANRDVTSGGATSGITAASAISALQEAGNKASRDMIAASYRAYVGISTLCIELIRQFYTEGRSFRITGTTGTGYEFTTLNNSGLQDQRTTDEAGNEYFRRPVFDLKIKAQKRNPFSRMEQNERAKELYGLGFFNPQRAQEALGALEMMDFEGIDKLKDYIRQGQTLLSMVEQLQQENIKLKYIVQQLTGRNLLGDSSGAQAETGGRAQASPGTGKLASDGFASGVMEAQKPPTPYMQALAKRSTPSMD